ncbi:MAG: hypothetical protein HC876_15270 [Chloroflexaceae bacterium]|nr:hypothetical protein [Chloroflexaceae bacterium]NJO06761.1 hypothetical protein [Chloroflexaceae bacterium]
MSKPASSIPISILDRATSPLDSYLLLILHVEQARLQLRWHTYCQLSQTTCNAPDAGDLAERLRHQFPAPHLDAVTDRIN